MRKLWWIVLGVTLTAASAGGVATAYALGAFEQTSVRGAKSLRKLACEQDVAGFWRRVDKEKVAELAMVEGRKVAEQNANGKPGVLMLPGVVEALEKKLKAAQSEAFIEWETQVRKGHDGDFCKTKVGQFDDGGGNVRVLTPSGRPRVWLMTEVDGTWMLTGMRERKDDEYDDSDDYE